MGWPMCPARLISQLGTIWSAWLWTDISGHGTFWDAGEDALGASVPDRCCSPASVLGPCTSPGLCAFLILTLSDCSEGWWVSAAPENRGMLHKHVCTYVYTYIHIQRYSLSSSQPPRTAFKKWYSGRRRKEEREIIIKGGNCKPFAGEKENDSYWERRGTGGVGTSRNVGQATPKAMGQSKDEGSCRRHSVRLCLSLTE